MINGPLTHVSGLLRGIAGFQAALAAGAPWVAASWGGRHVGTLPAGLRIASAATCVVIGGLAYAVGRTPRMTAPGRRRLHTAIGDGD